MCQARPTIEEQKEKLAAEKLQKIKDNYVIAMETWPDNVFEDCLINPITNKKIKRINKKFTGISDKEFQEKYPGFPLVCLNSTISDLNAEQITIQQRIDEYNISMKLYPNNVFETYLVHPLTGKEREVLKHFRLKDENSDEYVRKFENQFPGFPKLSLSKMLQPFGFEFEKTTKYQRTITVYNTKPTKCKICNNEMLYENTSLKLSKIENRHYCSDNCQKLAILKRFILKRTQNGTIEFKFIKKDYVNAIYDYSPIVQSLTTGQFYNHKLHQDTWHYYNKEPIAQRLSKIFKFPLLKGQDTIDNIEDSIEIIRIMYQEDYLSPTEIFEILDYPLLKGDAASSWMINSLGIKSIPRTKRIAKRTDRNLYIKSFSDYRHASNFKFNIEIYNKIQGNELLEIYGYGKDKNKKLHLDHMFSVYDGYKYDINPELISHPGNAEFMLASDNLSKYKNSSITKKEFYKRIVTWEDAFGPYRNKLAIVLYDMDLDY